jgi:hypothetical protein
LREELTGFRAVPVPAIANLPFGAS